MKIDCRIQQVRFDEVVFGELTAPSVEKIRVEAPTVVDTKVSTFEKA
jgi:hypothetical protein